MLYPCIGNFGELVNSLLFRLAIQVSICKFCWRHQSCLEPFIHIGWEWNGYDGHHIQLTLHCRVSLAVSTRWPGFLANLLLAGLGCFRISRRASSFCGRLYVPRN
jgi:hypothetical protein